MFKKLCTTTLCCAAFAGASTTANANTMVDLELQLLTDVSGSINAAEYALQMQGYENAFRNATVHAAIAAGALGSIAVQYVEWSSNNQQAVKVDWTLIDSVASSNAFADQIALITRSYSNQTAPGSAINFGYGLFDTNQFDAARQVIDISGDGVQNDGADTSDARDTALAAGVDSINGITIGNAANLQQFYQDNVVGGNPGFHAHAIDFTNFGQALLTKVDREIRDVPAPASVALFGLALMGLVGSKRKRTA